jgi:acyl-CoA synthetase (AMP-forming)/AMP-acid ligase II
MGMSEVEGDRAALVEQWYDAGFYGTTTVGEEIRRARSAGAIVFSSDTEDVEHDIAEIRARSEALARGLRAIGMRPGDAVAIQLPTTPVSMAIAGAVWIAGGIVLPIVDIYGRHEVSHILHESATRFLVVPTVWRGREYAAEAVEWFGDDLDAIIAIGENPPVGTVSEDDLALDGEPIDIEGSPEDIALLVYTSGTTSEPKGVQHSHNTFLANGFRDVGDDSFSPTSLGTFPAGHIAGILSIVRPLLRGGTTVIMDRWSAKRAARLVEQYQVMASSGTPFYLATLLNEAEQDGRDISSLFAFLTGAAPVQPALLERAAKWGIISWRSYGSTEHPVISGGGPHHTEDQRHRTDGEVSPGVEVRILDEADNDLPVGAEGEIVVRGPKQFLGYRAPGLNDESFLAGFWYRTGDIGRLDQAGHLTITDRKKDVIIRGGENISSKEVEDVLMQHPAVSEIAVCSAPDEIFGESVCAFVLLRKGAALTLDDVRQHFEALGVASQKTPTRLEVVDDFPRTASGKIRKVDLRQSLARPETSE